MKQLLILTSATGALLLAGCSTYSNVTQATADAFASGNIQVAAQQSAERAAKNTDSKDTVIYHLEAGATHRTLGLASLPPAAPAAPVMGGTAAEDLSTSDLTLTPFMESIKYFSVADERIDRYEEEAKKSVAAGVTAAISNPASIPYRGRAYDKILASTYQALNFMAIGDLEKARASLNKAYRRQADAVAENDKRIEKQKAKIEAAKSGTAVDEEGKSGNKQVDVERANQDPKTSAALAEVNQSLDARIKAYGDYVNPFTVFVDGLFMMYKSTDGQEQERASVQFKRVASMSPDNAFLMADAVLAEKLAAGNQHGKLTYVIFETGVAAHRKELLIPIPVFLVTNELNYAQIAVPRLEYSENFSPSLVVTAGEQSVSTALIADMDSVISRDFKNELPSIWTDAIITTTTKALIDYGVQEATKRQGWQAQLLAKVASAAFTAATNRADTRSWRSLPKQFAYARVDTPESGSISISVPNSPPLAVTLPDAKVTVVYVKQTQSGSPLYARAFVLKQ